jgi:hypothetical protein
MNQERPFPEELLLQSSQIKTSYFKSITVPHKKLKTALDNLLINVLEPADTLVFLVFGVTGVGVATCNANRSDLQLRHLQARINCNYNCASARIICN